MIDIVLPGLKRKITLFLNSTSPLCLSEIPIGILYATLKTYLQHGPCPAHCKIEPSIHSLLQDPGMRIQYAGFEYLGLNDVHFCGKLPLRVVLDGTDWVHGVQLASPLTGGWDVIWIQEAESSVIQHKALRLPNIAEYKLSLSPSGGGLESDAPLVDYGDDIQTLYLVECPGIHNLTASIVRHKVVEELYSRTYIIYDIEVRHGETQWVVSRRFEEFERLNKALLDISPHSGGLQQLSWRRRLGQMRSVSKRMELNQYLERILQDTNVTQSIPFLSFFNALSACWYKEQEGSTSTDVDTRSSAKILPREIIHVKSLVSCLSTGDIVLFQGKHRLSTIQRSFTRAVWDHIGIVVKDPGEGYCLLEANIQGVKLLPIVPRLQTFALKSSCIVLRKLRTKEPIGTEMLWALKMFVSNVDGKPYSLNLLKSWGPGDTSKTPESFFCSELVVAALRSMNLVDSDVAPSNYWPGNFGIGGKVDKQLLKHGASFGDEILIDCREARVARANEIPHSP